MFCCNPPVDQKLVLLKLTFLKETTFMLNQQQNLKSGKKKDKEKEFERKKKTENQKNRKDWWKTNFKI